MSATVSVLLAWIFAVSAAGVCDFMAREGLGFSWNDVDSLKVDSFKVGLFAAKGSEDKCHSFDYYDFNVDGAIRAGQAFAVMTSVFGGLALVATIVGIFIHYPPIIWRIMVVALFVLVPFQLCTFSALGAEICTIDV